MQETFRCKFGSHLPDRKRVCICLVCFWLTGAWVVCANAGTLRTKGSLPNQIRIAWAPVAGASWYDFYEGDVGSERFLVRLAADALAPDADGLLTWTVGGNDAPLYPETDYRIVFAARGDNDSPLVADALQVRTGSWSGVYRWSNPTSDDNGGRVRDITITVKRGSDIAGFPVYYEMYGDFPREGVSSLQKVFPLLPLDSGSFGWISYGDQTPAAVAYRLNAEKFNKTSFKPRQWRIRSIKIGPKQYVTEIVTKALGFEVTTVSTYAFVVDEHDDLALYFQNRGSGIASVGLFFNPEDGGSPFILRKID